MVAAVVHLTLERLHGEDEKLFVAEGAFSLPLLLSDQSFFNGQDQGVDPVVRFHGQERVDALT